MAHSRSALKRWRQSLERRDRNRSTKSRTRTLFTRALFTIDDDPNAAEAAVRAAVSALDKAAQKGVIHPNAAARSKSRLLKRFNLATAGAVAAAAAAPPSAAGTEAEAPSRPPRRRSILPRRPAGETEAPAPARRTSARSPRQSGDAPKTPRSHTRKT